MVKSMTLKSKKTPDDQNKIIGKIVYQTCPNCQGQRGYVTMTDRWLDCSFCGGRGVAGKFVKAAKRGRIPDRLKGWLR